MWGELASIFNMREATRAASFGPTGYWEDHPTLTESGLDAWLGAWPRILYVPGFPPTACCSPTHFPDSTPPVEASITDSTQFCFFSSLFSVGYNTAVGEVDGEWGGSNRLIDGAVVNPLVMAQQHASAHVTQPA